MHIIILLHYTTSNVRLHATLNPRIYTFRAKRVSEKKKNSKIAVQQFHLNLFPTIHAIRQLRKRAATILRANN